jgi:hypothetical protein
MTKRKKSGAANVAPDIFEQAVGIDATGRLIRLDDVGLSRLDPQIKKWLDAINDADGGSKSKLVALMKSGTPLPEVIIPHIGDLIDRWDWVRPKHRMRIPSYQLTDNELRLDLANCEVNELLDGGVSLSDALKEVATQYEEHGIKETVLREYHDKRRGHDRRAKARSYKRKR